MTDTRFTEAMIATVTKGICPRRDNKITPCCAQCSDLQDIAILALTALTDSSVILPREATAEMIRAGHLVYDEYGTTTEVYRAMRDAALGGKG
jgi:hypothetical protein